MSSPKTKRVVGLDMHPDSFTAAILVGTTPHDARQEKVTDKMPLNAFENWLQKNCDRQDIILIEASGNTFGMCERALAIGYEIMILESKQVAKHSSEDWSNDRNSAVLLCRVFLSGLIRDEVWLPNAKTRQRRQILGSYQESVKDSTRITNRIRSFLNEHTIRLPSGMKLTSKKARGRALRAKTWTVGETLILDQAFDDLARAQSKQKEILRYMAEDISKDATLLQLMRVFGVGVITAYALLATIGTIHRFKNAKKLVKYFGLAPRRHESGENDVPVKGKQKGKKDIRALLVECAHAAFRNNRSPLHKWAWRLALRKGHTMEGAHKDTRGRKIAAVAVARKIVTAVWYHMKGLPFTMADATQTLTQKLFKLAAHIGKDNVRASGFKTYKEFVLEKLKLIENTA